MGRDLGTAAAPPRRLELMLVVAFVAALIALTIWFFFLAENPPRWFI